MDIVTYAKNIGIVLVTVSTLAYGSGYLAIRARAHALGTDPLFTLVDEGYAFAGFRFLFITIVVLLLLSPVVLIIRTVSLLVISRIPAYLIHPLRWLLLFLLMLMTIITFKILSVNGLLLQQPNIATSNSMLKEAIMGGQPTIRLLLTFLTVLLATLSILWLLKARLSTGNELFALVLGVIVSIQIFMLPIYHGALFTDRKVRVLAAIPDTVKGISAPLGIVDRTTEHFTLLGCDSDGNRRLATIKLEDLNGIPIKKIVRLNEFVEKDLAPCAKSGVKGTGGLGAYDEKQESDGSKPGNRVKSITSNETDINRNFFAALVGYLNFTFETIASLSNSAVDAGQLWLVEIDASGTPSEPRRIGSFNNVSWPVVGPDGSTIYALQQGQVVRLGKDGRSTEVINSELPWAKLLGVTEDNSVLGFVYEGSETNPAILTKNGDIRVNRSPLSDEDQKLRSRLLQENRSYKCDKTLFVERSERGGRGFDVFLKTGNQVVNLSDCSDDRCGQPSLSPDFRLALFIRKPRY